MFKSPFSRKKSRKGMADSVDEDAPPSGKSSQAGSSKAGGPSGPGGGGGGSFRGNDAFRRNSMNSAKSGKSAGPQGGSPGDRQSQAHSQFGDRNSTGGGFPTRDHGRNDRNHQNGGLGGMGGGAAGGFDSFGAQRGGNRRSRPAREQDSEDETDETGIPKEWAQKPSRERRFTQSTRPEFFKGKKIEFEDEDDEEDEMDELLEKLNRELEEMEAKVEERAREDEDEDEEDEKGLGDMDFGRGGGGNSRRGSKGSRSSRGSKARKKRFKFPQEIARYKLPELYKKGNVRKNWTKRYWKVDPRGFRLVYYSDRYCTKMKGDIYLRGVKLSQPELLRKRKNPKINPEWEFVLQPKRGSRDFFLCALSQEDFFEWMGFLQTFLSAEQDHNFKHPKAHQNINDRAGEVEIDEEEASRKWDSAQNWTAFGRGLYEGRIGETVRFTIQANDEYGNRLMQSPGMEPSVVLESDDLHYDVEVSDNNDGTFTAQYVATRLGEYELSVLLDGYDIYGSPYHPRILAAPVHTTHCVADGVGLLCSVIEQTNSFTIYARNEFDELIDPEDNPVPFVVSMSPPLVLENVKYNKDSTYTVTYKVSCSEEDLRSKQAKGESVAGLISVTLDDGRCLSRVTARGEEIKLDRHIRGSPFAPGLAASLSPEDIAAAYTASEFSRLLNKTDVDSSAKEPVNPFLTFSNLLKSSGFLTEMNDQSKSSAPATNGYHNSEPNDFISPASSLDSPIYGMDQIPVVGSTQRGGPMGPPAPGPPPPEVSLPSSSAYFPMLSVSSQGDQARNGGVPVPLSVPPPPTHPQQGGLQRRQHQQQQQQQYTSNVPLPTDPPPRRPGTWIPTPRETPLVQESLEERAREIEREKMELVQKRKELDESRSLIDEQVRRMAELGHKVQSDSAKMMEQAKNVSGSTSPSPLKYAVKENLVNNPNQRNGGRSTSPQKQKGDHRSGGQSSPPPISSSQRLVLDRPLIALFDQHSVVLSRVYEYYKQQNATHVVQLSDVIKLAQDYDITPTFISQKEIREIVNGIRNRFQDPLYSLTYESFLETLANIAVHSLSKPMFAHLYTTNLKKVNVLLTMWGLADALKLSEIQKQSEEGVL